MIDTREQLKRAYKLIKQEKTSEAEQLLRPILDSEPENVHAWWLLAHSIDDPREVRQALTTVLDLDPNYENAGKARELLAELDRFQPQADSSSGVFEDFDEEMLLSSMPAGAVETPSLFDDASASDSMFSPQDDFLFETDKETEEALGAVFEIPEELEKPEKTQKSQKSQKTPKAAKQTREVTDLSNLFGDVPEFDDEALAAREERAARGKGRGRRLLRVALLLLIPAALVVALVLTMSGDDTAKEDPAPLLAVDAPSDTVRSALASAENELAAAGLGTENRVFVADSAVGKTLFVEFCSQPSPQLASQVMRGMVIAAQQAPTIKSELMGIGVSVNLCNGEQRDSLYRAYVPVDTAIQYLDGQFGSDETGTAGFQDTWKTS